MRATHQVVIKAVITNDALYLPSEHRAQLYPNRREKIIPAPTPSLGEAAGEVGRAWGGGAPASGVEERPLCN